uniref:Uncharacterized protein n=1 Tax=Kalanchoe fedtschenkoi TaxID=63787 RepID=A0A7N1A503_KALFE
MLKLRPHTFASKSLVGLMAFFVYSNSRFRFIPRMLIQTLTLATWSADSTSNGLK